MHDNISSQVADKRREGFGQWMKSFNIHDNISSLIHKCHPKSYHSNIKYHTTRNIIFSVVTTVCVRERITALARCESLS